MKLRLRLLIKGVLLPEKSITFAFPKFKVTRLRKYLHKFGTFKKSKGLKRRINMEKVSNGHVSMSDVGICAFTVQHVYPVQHLWLHHE